MHLVYDARVPLTIRFTGLQNSCFTIDRCTTILSCDERTQAKFKRELLCCRLETRCSVEGKVLLAVNPAKRNENME